MAFVYGRYEAFKKAHKRHCMNLMFYQWTPMQITRRQDLTNDNRFVCGFYGVNNFRTAHIPKG